MTETETDTETSTQTVRLELTAPGLKTALTAAYAVLQGKLSEAPDLTAVVSGIADAIRTPSVSVDQADIDDVFGDNAKGRLRGAAFQAAILNGDARSAKQLLELL